MMRKISKYLAFRTLYEELLCTEWHSVRNCCSSLCLNIGHVREVIIVHGGFSRSRWGEGLL